MKVLLLIALFLAPSPGQVQAQTGIITGRLSKNGQPAAGIRVSAMVIPDPGVPLTEATALASVVLTDSDGRYRLDNIPPGRYYVTAGFLDIPTYYPGVSLISRASSVAVEAGAIVTGIDFTTAAPAGVSASGRVVFPTGQTATGRASLSDSGNPPQDVALGSDGSFEFSRLRPGTYTLRVSGAGTVQPIAIIVSEADITGIEIPVPFTVTGTITVERSGPLPNVSLSFISDKSDVTATLSPDGSFTSLLPEGEYRVAVSGLPSGYTLRSITAGSTNVLTNSLKVDSARGPEPVAVTIGVAVPPPWVKVSGKVMGPGFSQNSFSYPLALKGSGLLNPVNLRVATDGSFELAEVLPGDYTLSALGQVAPIPSVSLRVGNTDLSGIEVVVPAMKEVTGRVMVEGAGRTVRIAVAGAQAPTSVGLPAGRAVQGITLQGPTAPPLTFAVTGASGTTSVTATPQADGTFRVALPVGDHRIELSTPGFDVKSLSYGSTDLLQNPSLMVSETDTVQLEATVGLPARAGAAFASIGVTTAGVGGTVLIGAPTVRVAYFVNAAGGVSQAQTMVFLGPAETQLSANAVVYAGSDVAESNLLSAIPPLYSSEARSAGIQDPVVLQATIDKEGKVTNPSVVRGHPLLNDAAIEAVKQWRYRPQLINGEPTSVVTTITVNFPRQ